MNGKVSHTAKGAEVKEGGGGRGGVRGRKVTFDWLPDEITEAVIWSAIHNGTS